MLLPLQYHLNFWKRYFGKLLDIAPKLITKLDRYWIFCGLELYSRIKLYLSKIKFSKDPILIEFVITFGAISSQLVAFSKTHVILQLHHKGQWKWSHVKRLCGKRSNEKWPNANKEYRVHISQWPPYFPAVAKLCVKIVNFEDQVENCLPGSSPVREFK